MALRFPTAVLSSSFIRSHRKATSNTSNVNHLSVAGASKAVATANVSDQKIVRRSANYHPPIWEYDYIQSLKSDYLVYIYVYIIDISITIALKLQRLYIMQSENIFTTHAGGII